MATDLVSLVMQFLTPDVIGRIASCSIECWRSPALAKFSSQRSTPLRQISRRLQRKKGVLPFASPT
jgi:hypothetical protein